MSVRKRDGLLFYRHFLTSSARHVRYLVGQSHLPIVSIRAIAAESRQLTVLDQDYNLKIFIVIIA